MLQDNVVLRSNPIWPQPPPYFSSSATGMLQLFRMDVAKVDRDVAYVVMVVHICCKLLFSMFHLFFFKHMLQVYLFGCCICFTRVTIVVSGCCISVFASVSDICFKCFICLLLYVASVTLHLNVSKVD